MNYGDKDNEFLKTNASNRFIHDSLIKTTSPHFKALLHEKLKGVQC